MEIFTPSREAIAYKRNLNSLSIAIIVSKFLDINPANLPYFGEALESVSSWKIDVVLLSALGIFALVYSLTWWRDWMGWKAKEGIDGEAQDQIFEDMKLIMGSVLDRELLKEEEFVEKDWMDVIKKVHHKKVESHADYLNRFFQLKVKYHQAPKTASARKTILNQTSKWSDQVFPSCLGIAAVGFSVFRWFF